MMREEFMKEFERVLRNLAEVFECDENEDEEIRIIKKGKRITAAYYIDGECFRHANAKCSENDVFSFEKGSKLAFKRLWGDPDA